MKQGSTLLKVVSIIMIVYGIFLAGLGLLSTLGGGALIADADAVVASGGLAIIGIAFLFSGLLEVVIGFAGLKASPPRPRASTRRPSSSASSAWSAPPTPSSRRWVGTAARSSAPSSDCSCPSFT